jgi:hypothetical protein
MDYIKRESKRYRGPGRFSTSCLRAPDYSNRRMKVPESA